MSVFTPDTEPYLGLHDLAVFDEVIAAALKESERIATQSYSIKLTSLQRAATQIVPSGISLVLSQRELIRQAYLYGALVLTRPICERAYTLMYLERFPNKLGLWEAGWAYNKRPSLARIINDLSKDFIEQETRKGRIPEDFNLGRDGLSEMNSLVHGDPESSNWDIIVGESGSLGFATSKILDRPELAAKAANDGLTFLSILIGYGAKIFPRTEPA